MTSYFEMFAIFCILLLPFLYETSHVFRYHFKYMIYYGLVSLIAVILIPVMIFRPCDIRNLLWSSKLCRHIAKLLSIKWELRGSEYLVKEQPYIIVSNHQSSLDILGLFCIWSIMGKCTVVAKRELMYAGPFGLGAYLSGIVFIDRIRSEKARVTLNATNRRIKEKNIKLLVFPEGTRRNTGEIHPFKKGAFHMAIDADIPILPLVFSSYVTFLDSKKKILNPGDVIITALPPISTSNLTKDDLPKLMADIHSKMSETYKATSAEILAKVKATHKGSLELTHQVRDIVTNEELSKKQRTIKEAVKAQ